MNLGTRLRAISNRMIRKYGSKLTVRRNGTGAAGAGETQQSVYFLVQDLSRALVDRLQVEGAHNAYDFSPIQFVCDGSEDVREAVDTVEFGGEVFRIMAVVPDVLNGVQAIKYCLGTREKIVT